MADVLNDFAISRLAQYILGLGPPDPTPVLCLFVSNTTIECDTVPADLTECTCGGYARITLTPANWTIDDTTPCIVDCSYGSCVFTLTDNGGGQTIHGHYILDTVANNILWAQTWTTPFAVPAGGGVVEVFPFYTSEQCSG